MPNEHIVLRTFPDNPLFDLKKYPKSLAFSPDIIPQYGNTPSVANLTDDSAFGGIVGLPLVPHDDNYIFIRGLTCPDTSQQFKAVVTLRAVPSELILWPQVWSDAKALAPGPLVISGGEVYWFERVASSVPFKFRPSYMGGIGYALIAHHPTLPGGLDTSQRLRDYLPPLPQRISNCRDFYNFVTTDESTTYYNVLIADPTSPVVSVTTRLRMFDDDPNANITLMISVSHAGVPVETEVSLSSDCGQIHVPRRKISNASAGVAKIIVKAGYDGYITMNVFRTSENPFDPYSWLSLRANLIIEQGPFQCLGAQNILFEPDSARNIRLASPAAVNGRDAVPPPGTATVVGQSSSAQPTPAAAPPAPPTPAPVQQRAADPPSLVRTRPAVTGWWFRSRPNDVNYFPRSTADPVFYISPDIQLVGSRPINPAILLNPQSDYCSDNKIRFSSDEHNYVYVRGHSTMPGIITECRLFFFPNSALLHPSFYTFESQYAVKDEDGQVAIRTLTTHAGQDFYVFEKPFDLHSIPNPVDLGANHYCMIAEIRQRRSPHEDPHWPHEDHEEFAVAFDFTIWVASECCVAWKNIDWVPCTTHICICVKVIIPVGTPCSTCWTIIIESFNAPPGSSWQLTSSGPTVPGLTIGFDKRTLGAANSIWGCHFTGAPVGYETTLKFEWFAEGQPIPSGLFFNYHLGCYSANNISPAGSLAYPPVPGNENWPFYVGDKYPNLSGCMNAPLVPKIDKVGLNPWPFANGKFYRVGGDRWNAVS